MTSPEFKIDGLDFYSDDVLRLSYTMEEELADASNKVNVVLASFTTAYARLHLLDFLHDRAENTIYFDTGKLQMRLIGRFIVLTNHVISIDSIVYIQKEGEKDLKTGSMLGELCSELDPGDWIISFCCTGPKSYGYITAKGKIVVKIKGKNIQSFEKLEY
jgi:hypothetical protein